MPGTRFHRFIPIAVGALVAALIVLGSGSVASAAVAAPTVTGVSPGGGPPAGGTRVTVTGTGFVAGATVRFGATYGTAVKVKSSTSLLVTAPAHPAGKSQVRVTTPSGTSAYSSRDYYTYVNAPTVTGLSPASGLPSGGAAVTITGTGFVDGATVKFGRASATNVRVVSSTSITVTAPAGALGRVTVRVTTPSGPSALGDSGSYTYIAAPTVTGVSPARGPSAGDGGRVTVSGSGFITGAIVRFGATAATSVTVISPTQLTVAAPAHAAGRIQVRVTTPSGASAYSTADFYTYGANFGTLSVVAGRCAFDPPAAATQTCITPYGVAVDAAGNKYLADGKNNVVEKVAPDGTLSVLAGNGQVGAPTPGPATDSKLNLHTESTPPAGVAVDSVGNVYIADAGNDVIEKVAPNGILSFAAGTRHVGYPTPGPATSADLAFPEGVAVDSADNLYIADTYNDEVEKVTPAGTLSIVTKGLSLPEGVAVDSAGNVYAASNGVVKKFTPGGATSVVAGTGTPGPPTPGPATGSALGDPTGFAVDSAGNLYLADGANHVIEKVTPNGILSVVAGTGTFGTPTPGPATGSALGDPVGVAVDPAGVLYIADYYENVIERVTPGGTLSVVAGVGTSGAPTPGPATDSALGGPKGVSVDSAGNVYIADSINNVIEKVTPGGTLTVVAGTGTSGAPTPGPATSSKLNGPVGVALDSAGNLYIADTGNNVIEKVTQGGTLSVVAGTGTSGAPTPGPATSSKLNGPVGVALDSAGNLYIADTGNNVIEKVTPGGTLSVVAGTGTSGSPTPGPATSSKLYSPGGVAVDSAGNLYIADSGNNSLEKVTPDGTLSIVASRIRAGGVAVDPAGDVYTVVDGGSGNVVYEVSPFGTISVAAGTGRAGPPTPGPATDSDLDSPFGVAVDSAGTLYVADTGNADVEKVI